MNPNSAPFNLADSANLADANDHALTTAAFTQASGQMINEYVQQGQQNVQLIGITAHRTAHHPAQLDRLIARAAKAEHAMQVWKQRGRAMYLGKYMYSDDIASHFSARFPVHCLDMRTPYQGEQLTQLMADLQDCVVIVNGNDFGSLSLLQTLYLNCPDTLFICCLYDNHHALDMCILLSLCSDMVFPAHYDYLALLNRYNPFVRGPLPASSLQWSKIQARRFEPKLYAKSRQIDLSGGFTRYPQFPFRQSIVEKVMAQKVGESLELPSENTVQHHSVRSKEENWEVWASSKANLVVSTLTDLPHRFFDALLTGNIPLVPRYLQVFFSHFDFSQFSHMPVVWFDYADLPDMTDKVAQAVAMFDAAGKNGIMQRHRFILDQHMLENRFETILDDVHQLLENKANQAHGGAK